MIITAITSPSFRESYYLVTSASHDVFFSVSFLCLGLATFLLATTPNSLPYYSNVEGTCKIELLMGYLN